MERILGYRPVFLVITLFAFLHWQLGCNLLDKKREGREINGPQPPPVSPTPPSPQDPTQISTCPLPETLPVQAGLLSTREFPLKSLNQGHPRIYLTQSRLLNLRNLLDGGDPQLTAYMEALSKKVAEIEKRPPLVPTSDGSENQRLMSSPEASDRILYLAGHYILTGDVKSGQGAIAVMKAAASFRDWHPGHFLDTSVMAYAVAVGYDWTYDLLSEEDRNTILNAIVNKGIKPAITEYKNQTWWTKSADNWPLVNGGAIGIAALAIGDRAPEPAAEVLRHILANLEKPLKNFAPDGGWPEGPMYWGYGAMYFYGLVDALLTAVGTDFGLSLSEGLSESGYFRIYTTGPSQRPFSFYDTGEGIGSADFMHWLARRYQKPYFSQIEKSLSGLSSMRTILWYAPGCLEPKASPTRLSKIYPRMNVAALRLGEDPQNSIYIGFKGGDNRTSHGHLDLGSFVLDADGARWAIDLGGDAYTVPGYFDARIRPTLYRISTQGHNTLTIAKEPQNPLQMPSQALNAKAPLVAYKDEETASKAVLVQSQQKGLPKIYAVADLNEAYLPLTSKARRGIGIKGDNTVLLVDEVESANGALSVVSHFHTRAKVDLKGNLAILTTGGKLLRLKLLSPKDASFEVISANPRDKKPNSAENPNQDVKDIIVRTRGTSNTTRIVLWMVPGRSSPSEEPEPEKGIPPLSQWIEAAPL